MTAREPGDTLRYSASTLQGRVVTVRIRSKIGTAAAIAVGSVAVFTAAPAGLIDES